MVVALSVTAVCARARPVIVAPVLNVIAVFARMIPLKLAVVPRVAAAPTTQKTFSGCAPAGERHDGAVPDREVLRDLEDPHNVGAARQRDGRRDGDASAPLVDTRDEGQALDVPGAQFSEVGRGAAGAIGVRRLHVEHRGGQVRRGRHRIVGGEDLAGHQRRGRIAGRCGQPEPGDERRGGRAQPDIAHDGGVAGGRDAGLGQDHVIAGRAQIDRGAGIGGGGAIATRRGDQHRKGEQQGSSVHECSFLKKSPGDHAPPRGQRRSRCSLDRQIVVFRCPTIRSNPLMPRCSIT